MNLLQAIVLGVVQGLTEFLPISSSGHLLIVPKALGWKDPGAAFTAIIQLGTMLAIVIAFRRDIAEVGGAWVSSLFRPERRGTPEARLGWVIVVGTIPISVVGLLLKDHIEGGARNIVIVAIALIVGGIIMEICDRATREDRTIETTRVKDGWIMGAAQALALLPGVSRSGATISAGRVLGFERAAAARVSFLLSIPAVVLSGLVELKSALGTHLDVAPVVVATIVSFVVGYASIRFLMDYLGKHRLTVFTVYRIALGVIILVVVAVN
ncbi:MAG: undecaprenyl-diphosphate phosphatase [Thermoleophilia bacterium]|nr:undecaprenyl-diphosphate phosphatase [Thermoleophilia bacterium]